MIRGELWYETYLIDKQKQIYHCTVYYKNGVIESEGTVLKDGTRDGEWKEYFFKDDFENGPVTTYYENGNVKVKGQYIYMGRTCWKLLLLL